MCCKCEVVVDKTKYCRKCDRILVDKYGGVHLCHCDLKDIKQSAKEIKRVKVKKNGLFKGFIENTGK